MNNNQTVNLNQIVGEYTQDNYAMYLRKSRADAEMEALGEGETLARHEHMLYALAEKYSISASQITVYREVVSGDSIQDRPEMQRLLADVYQRKYKGVLVVEVERLARGNTKDQGEVSDAFQYSHTKIITPVKIYDPNNDMDQEYFEFGLFMSRREYKTIRRRLEAGKQSSVEEGNYVLSQRVFGYDIKRISKKERILVPREDEAPLVKMMFDWYTEENRSFDWIAKKFTEMGVPTVYKKPEWSKNTIRDMMQSVYYIGQVTWGEKRSVKVLDENTGKLVRKKEKTNATQYYKGKHTPLISEEQFAKAAKIRKLNAAPPKKINTELRNPLAGLLRCKDCGAMMTFSDYAQCPSNGGYNTATRIIHPLRQKCKKKSLATSLIMDALSAALLDYIEDCKIKLTAGNDDAEIERHKDAIAAMEAELDKNRSRKLRLMESWEDGDGLYTKTEYIDRKNMYDTRIAELEAKIVAEKSQVPEPVNYEEIITSTHKMIEIINSPSAKPKDINFFLKNFISRIDYDIIDYGLRKGGKPILDIHFL